MPDSPILRTSTNKPKRHAAPKSFATPTNLFNY
jgi:hypothetical protein